ncbi:MAG: hypothetical protein ABWZ82_08590 [Candidatus Limnocylindrales bacterium]
MTIIGALVGQAVGNNIDFLRDLIPVANTSIGVLLSIIVGGGIGGAIGGMIGNRT